MSSFHGTGRPGSVLYVQWDGTNFSEIYDYVSPTGATVVNNMDGTVTITVNDFGQFGGGTLVVGDWVYPQSTQKVSNSFFETVVLPKLQVVSGPTESLSYEISED